MLSGLTTALPWVGTVTPATVSGSLSGSESLARTLMVTAAPWLVVAESLLATGATLTSLTSMETVAVAALSRCPSFALNGNESAPT